MFGLRIKLRQSTWSLLSHGTASLPVGKHWNRVLLEHSRIRDRSVRQSRRLGDEVDDIKLQELGIWIDVSPAKYRRLARNPSVPFCPQKSITS